LRQKEQQRVFLSRHEGSSNSTRYRFGKSELSGAQVIQQVDRKFIACLIQREASSSKSGDNDRILVLVDQHAADERVRVERYLKELCIGFLTNVRGISDPTLALKTRDLSTGVPILLTTHEVGRLAESPEIQTAFSNWGIRFEGLAQIEKQAISGDRGEDSSGYFQVIVRSIPEVVSDKVCYCFPVIAGSF
jgi:DNA mismatch repair protein MLH3